MKPRMSLRIGAGSNRKRSRAKGFIYTLFVLAFLLSLSLFLAVQGDHNYGGLVAEKIRGDELGYFVNGVQDDLGRGALISGRKAVLALSNSMINTGQNVSSANDTLLELVRNGSMNGAPSSMMQNSTLLGWEARLQQIGTGKNIGINISTENLSIRPASAFEIAVAGNATIVAYDPLTRIKYNRTVPLFKAVSVEGLEDPYITVKSLGNVRNTIAGCRHIGGTAPGQWTYGTAYLSNTAGANYAGLPAMGSKILVTNTISDKSGYSAFNAIVTEDGTASGTYYLRNAAGAYSAVRNNTHIVLSNNFLWITNDSSCYFEAPSGPSFLDRLEGRGTNSPKYDFPGIIEGMGAFVYIDPLGYCLDYRYYGAGLCT